MVASRVEELINMLYEMMEDAKSLPFGADKCILDRDKVLDLMDEIRAQMPTELSEAKKLLAAKTEYISSTRREAEMIKRQAEEHARRLISEDNVMIRAREQSEELMRTSRERAKELQRAANEYCEDALKRAEQMVGGIYNEMKEARSRFRTAAVAPVGQKPSESAPSDEGEGRDASAKTGGGKRTR